VGLFLLKMGTGCPSGCLPADSFFAFPVLWLMQPCKTTKCKTLILPLGGFLRRLSVS